MTLTIGTQNEAKYQSIKSLVHSVLGKRLINCQKVNKSIPPPFESGSSSKENCVLKVEYYQKYLSSPFIVADDAIYLPKALFKIPSHQFHGMGNNKELSPELLFKELYDKVVDSEGYTLVIERYFGCVNGDFKVYFKNSFKGKLFPMSSKQYLALLKGTISQNPLNYFLYTETGSPLTSLNERESVATYSDQSRNKVSQFINSLGS